MNKKKFYKKVEDEFGEDISDLFYMIDENKMIEAKSIVDYFRKEFA